MDTNATALDLSFATYSPVSMIAVIFDSGWVIPTNVKAFDPATADDNKIKNKSLKAAVFEALGFCDRVSKGAASMIEGWP